MRKVIAFCLALVLFCGYFLYSASSYSDEAQYIFTNRKTLNYFIYDEKFNCPDAIGDAMDENTVLLLGSSELEPSKINNLSYPASLFNNGNSDFNLMLVGRGWCQSLSQAIFAGAFADRIKNKKIVLSVSPQWFTQSGVTGDAFCARFYDRTFAAFMKNEQLSDDTKEAVLARCRQLMTGSPDKLETVETYASEYLYHNASLLSHASFLVSDAFSEQKSKHLLYKMMRKKPLTPVEETANASTLDYNDLLQQAENRGEAYCTNNPFYIYDDYYNKYVASHLDTSAGANANASFCTSPEYDDLKLFLQVCSESNIEVMLIIVPVNGFWYDYTGFPTADRQQYYQNIRDIAGEYNARLLDLSSYEHTPYFLSDIMHLGWKGWVYVIQGIYEFYQEGRQ